MKDEFWEACKEYDITINPTKYPIKLDYDAMAKKAEAMGVKFRYFNDPNYVKTMLKTPIDVSAPFDARESFLNCYRPNQCIMLNHGRLYTCSVAANAHILKERFSLDIELSDDNSVDIYKAQSATEVALSLARPIPFCKYCNTKGMITGIPYEQSKCTIDEWV